MGKHGNSANRDSTLQKTTILVLQKQPFKTPGTKEILSDKFFKY